MSKGLSLFSRCGKLRNKENMTGIRNCDDDDDHSCSKKTIMTCDNVGGGAGAWSDLTHHVLFLVMMQLGVIDFVAFKGVCKSWRSFALSNMNTFMASRPPMFLHTEECKVRNAEWCCHLKDVEGRRFKTLVPHSHGTICVGITCGYMILFWSSIETCGFCLVNIITRHELHFPNAPRDIISHAPRRQVRAILVFSPSISGGCGGWVFVVLNTKTPQIWFSRGESGAWDLVSSTVPMHDLQFFNGKIYTLHDSTIDKCVPTEFIGVMSLESKSITFLETQDFPSFSHLGFVCSGENLYLLQEPYRYLISRFQFMPYILDFDEMKWVVADENTHAFFLTYESHCGVVKPESWWQPQFRVNTSELCGNDIFFKSDRFWYFPHECLNINRMDE